MTKVSNKIVDGFLENIPAITSNVFYEMQKQNNGKIPRYPSVYKQIKTNFRYFTGYAFKDLNDIQQTAVEEIVRDTFYGIKEAETM